MSSDVCEICQGEGLYRLDLPVGHAQFGKIMTCECRQRILDAEIQGTWLAEMGALWAFSRILDGRHRVVMERFLLAVLVESPKGVLQREHSNGSTSCTVR